MAIERLKERGRLTLLWADGTRLEFGPSSTVHRIVQTVTLPHNIALLNLLESGDVVVTFGPLRMSETIGVNKATPKRQQVS